MEKAYLPSFTAGGKPPESRRLGIRNDHLVEPRSIRYSKRSGNAFAPVPMQLVHDQNKKSADRNLKKLGKRGLCLAFISTILRWKRVLALLWSSE